MGKIKINPKNKGKFTAWAKAHGMTVQQAASRILANRSKYSPTLIKRANFARNAAKWEEGGIMLGVGNTKVVKKKFNIDNVMSYADGGFMDVLGNVSSALGPIGSAISIGSSIVGMFGAGNEKREAERLAEQNRIKSLQTQADSSQAGIVNQYPAVFKSGGMFKGKRFGYKSGEDNAIVGGGEIVMTPDGVPTNMKGPSDMGNGKGIPVQMPNGTIIINKKDSKDILPLTGKINKNKEVLASGGTMLNKNSSQRNLNKYYSKVLDTYRKQEAKKFAKGGRFGYEAPDDLMQLDAGMGSLNNWQKDISFSNPLDDPNSTQFDPAASRKQALKQAPFGTRLNYGLQNTDWGNVAEGIGSMAPALYNIGQGLFGKREHQNAADYANPYEGKINSLLAGRQYNIDPELAANEASFRTTAANLRNTGGSGGGLRSNLMAAQNVKQFGDMSAYAQKKNMENQYASEYASALYPMGRDTAMTRMQVDEGNLATDASGRNMIGAGMTGLQQYLLTKRQMKNQSNRDKLIAQAIRGYSPYSGKWIPGLNDLT